ncbi:MAG: 4Fe-4S dicluster domain-containing protein, partial [Chitinophagales bacterium]|nr:4Fe-4S dicluster domain-containing protein [Chitinophagales bacterium]
STSNRAMIGGMVGNNSSGSYSLKYHTTRENVLACQGFLSDSSPVCFEDIDKTEFSKKLQVKSLESSIYRQLAFELRHPLNQDEIARNFPKKNIGRRNSGYALDELMDTQVFSDSDKPLNLAKLICGSEGTLMILTRVKLRIHPIENKERTLVLLHFSDLYRCLEAVKPLLEFQPIQLELMDHHIIAAAAKNLAQAQNLKLIEQDAQAILLMEVEAELGQMEMLLNQIEYQIKTIFSEVSIRKYRGREAQQCFALRASGLGVLMNTDTTLKPIEFVEDTCVAPEDLPNYIREFNQIMKQYGTYSVCYAHAGAGELHLRPYIDMSEIKGREKFEAIAHASMELVKKYQGSLSGEHGDGIVRGALLEAYYGQRIYQLFQRIKTTWDPFLVLNRGKIVDVGSILEDIKTPLGKSPNIPTVMSFEAENGLLSLLNRCSGAGDCRKPKEITGTLCPSYHATLEEQHTTRGRAVLIRHLLQENPSIETLSDPKAKEVLNFCLGCKACKSECPSSVDISVVKSEVLNQFYQHNKRPFLQKILLNLPKIAPLASKFPQILNFIAKTKLPNLILGMPTYRDLAIFTPRFELAKVKPQPKELKKKCILVVDEFSEFFSSELAYQAIEILNHINFEVNIVSQVDLGRTYISLGDLDQGKARINDFLAKMQAIDTDLPIIGIEPSAILGLIDDIPKLAHQHYWPYLAKIKDQVYLFEEFVLKSYKTQEIKIKFKSISETKIAFHGHCHQKAMRQIKDSVEFLNIIPNYEAQALETGCCGMAGSFGYLEPEISQKVAQTKLIPQIDANSHNIISANGLSCRHQIHDLKGIQTFHPITLFHQAIDFERH